MNEKIFFVSAEVYPFAKVGGLADVAGALPKALSILGADVSVIMPYYGDVQEKARDFKIKPTEIRGVPIVVGDNVENFDLYSAKLPGSQVPIYFVKSEKYFDRKGIYFDPETKKDFPDQAERLIFFAKAVLESASALKFKPDILHTNDHHTSILPAYLKITHRHHPIWRNTATVLTIHNLAYQGIFPPETMDLMGLGEEFFYPEGPFEFYGNVNFLKIGIFFADAVNTVSPTYATEIQTPEYGNKLDGVLRSVSHKVFGIINGVDYSVWDPSVDENIEYKYSIDDLSGKRMMKSVVLRQFELPEELDIPLIGMIGRMADQKGFDLVAEILPELMKKDVKMVILGSGDPRYEKMFKDAQKKYPKKLSVYTGFNGPLAHKIEAGADMFLMPSRFEPCGLNQMYSLRYGTVPIVRKTGGLADTVIDVDEKPNVGTGFVFSEYSPQALLDTINRALMHFSERKEWRKIIIRGMKQDFSWEVSAKKYLELYRKAKEMKG